MNLSIIAEKANGILKNSSVIPIPIESIVQSLGIKLIAHDLGNDTSGVLIVQGESATIGYNQNESKVRNRFTIAHELGHFVLHKNAKGGLFVDKSFTVKFRGNNPLSSYKEEREANQFAACILMPEHLLKLELEKLVLDYTEDTTIGILAKKFGVSSIAMSYRIANVFSEEQ